MPRFRDLSIRHKLQRAGMLASLAALSFAAVSFVLYDLYTFRGLMVRRIVAEGRILAFNCVSPLLFNDAATAATTLASLKAEPRVESASVYAADGKLFASYARAGAAPADPGLPGD